MPDSTLIPDGPYCYRLERKEDGVENGDVSRYGMELREFSHHGRSSRRTELGQNNQLRERIRHFQSSYIDNLKFLSCASSEMKLHLIVHGSS